MTSLILMIAGLAGMSLFWILALLVWRIAPPPAATSNQALTATWHEEPTYVEPLPTRSKSEDEEIDRRATGIFVAQEDSPRPRTARENQDIATQPYKRARHGPR